MTLDSLGVITYRKALANEAVILTSPRTAADRLTINYKKINESYLHSQHKLDQMVDYVFTNECRFRYILSYFGEIVENYKCGKCDRCVRGESVPESVREYITEIMIRTLRLLGGKTTQNILIKMLKGTGSGGTNLKLSTYGSCRNYDSNELKTVVQDLISKKILNKEGNALVLKDEELLFVNENDEVQLNSEAEYEKDLELFNLLREARTKASKKFVQSAYLICPDEILREAAHQKPQNKTRLLSIEGFNSRMFNKVGEDFLEIIKSFSKDDKKENKEIPTNLKETYHLLKRGFNLSEIASMRKLDDAVISLQIETIIEYEPGIEIKKLFGSFDFDKIMNEIRNGLTDLRELKAKLNNEISFPLLRIAVAKYKSTSSVSSSGYQHAR
jgi:ATP-dependent DNA helicase RecQ